MNPGVGVLPLTCPAVCPGFLARDRGGWPARRLGCGDRVRAGQAAVAGGVLGPGAAELPVVGGLGEREQLPVSAWLTGPWSACTRHAYAGAGQAEYTMSSR